MFYFNVYYFPRNLHQVSLIWNFYDAAPLETSIAKPVGRLSEPILIDIPCRPTGNFRNAIRRNTVLKTQRWQLSVFFEINRRAPRNTQMGTLHAKIFKAMRSPRMSNSDIFRAIGKLT